MNEILFRDLILFIGPYVLGTLFGMNTCSQFKENTQITLNTLLLPILIGYILISLGVI